MEDKPFNLVLASTSRYRRELLSKLNIPFDQIDPEYTELEIENEPAAAKAQRLSLGKALAAQRLSKGTADLTSKHLFLGSDQVAECQGKILSKPGTFDRAVEQLSHCSGAWISFSTGAALVDSNGGVIESFIDTFALKFRELSEKMITDYLAVDKPFDCAGSIKAEGHGIVLIEETRGNDVNTLYGLPLIKLTSALARIQTHK